MSDVDENRMKILWEEGQLTAGEIARELGTTLYAVKGIARRRGWVRGRRDGAPPAPPKVRKDPEWSTIFSRLAEEHAKLDQVLAETRHVGRLHGV